MKTAKNQLPVSGASDADVAAIEDFEMRLARLDAGMERILEAAHPEAAPMVQLHAAAFFLYGQTEAADAEARKYLDRVVQRTSSLLPRELAWLEALEAWHAAAFSRAVARLEELLRQWPEDLVAAKAAEFLYYALGQQWNGARFRATLDGIAASHADNPDFLGMYSFARELCGDYSGAEAAAERSLELEPRNPWAQHALSHVLIKQGRVDEGRRRMEEFMPLLKTCSRVIYGHDAWHLGLLHLEEMDLPGAEHILREHVWGFVPDSVGEQVDAIALLWRMELAGFEGFRGWNEIAKRVQPHAGHAVIPFISAHHAYALARAESTAALETLLAAVRRRAGQSDEEALNVWQPMGVSLVEGSASLGRGDVHAAAEHLGAIVDKLTHGGGSDAQVDLFRQALFRALADDGQTSKAKTWLGEMNRNKPLATSLDEWFAAQVM